MRLEKNLNPTYRALRVAAGVILVVAAFVAHRLMSGATVVALVIAGVVSIASGAYGH